MESTLKSFVSDNDNSSSQLIPVAHQLAAAKAALRHENFEAAKELAVTGQEQVRKIEQARYQKQEQEQEEVRREIVRGLCDVLTGMGFNIERKELGEDNKVILIGKLPSGRTARFFIALDGTIDYDFDGYHRRGDCGKDSEKIRIQLEEQCQGQATVIETHWKDGVPNLTPGTTADSNQEQKSA